ncbi:hypothetical protein CYMTET_44321 [Cymbomonas tetramitiformis]|uniref:Uncharacterized protein n=1 Tax=Cymbomonas tetramitiformis TaxID=36881 RepID=A0AAE0F0S2_9CHLO|nr:hypothetical protein CYMTET_44321 [Cymbomonas tetramitiformis]|eukprot:gene829-1306_t
MDIEDPFLVIVNDEGTFVELRDPFHRPRPYKVVMQITGKEKLESEYHEMTTFDRCLAGFFVKKRPVSQIDATMRLGVECFIEKDAVGDVTLSIALPNIYGEICLKSLLPHIVDLRAFCLLTTSDRNDTVCAVCVLPIQCLAKQVWPRISSCVGTTYADGFTLIKLPTDREIKWHEAADLTGMEVLRETQDHQPRGICCDEILLDALKAYVHDEHDHMGFLAAKKRDETYNDMKVETGCARMTHHEDFCAIYRDDVTKEAYLVVYMRLPDFIEDQIFHLFVDNALTRDWNAWSKSPEVLSVLQYSESRRRAVAAYCFQRLLQSDVCSSVAETDKYAMCTCLRYQNITYNVILSESNTFAKPNETSRGTCFYKNSYNINVASGFMLCEKDSADAHPDLLTYNDATSLSSKEASVATGVPRWVSSEATFRQVCDLYRRLDKGKTEYRCCTLRPFQVLVPREHNEFRLETGA